MGKQHVPVGAAPTIMSDNHDGLPLKSRWSDDGRFIIAEFNGDAKYNSAYRPEGVDASHAAIGLKA